MIDLVNLVHRIPKDRSQLSSKAEAEKQRLVRIYNKKAVYMGEEMVIGDAIYLPECTAKTKREMAKRFEKIGTVYESFDDCVRGETINERSSVGA